VKNPFTIDEHDAFESEAWEGAFETLSPFEEEEGLSGEEVSFGSAPFGIDYFIGGRNRNPNRAQAKKSPINLTTIQQTVTGFGRFSDDIELLPPDQQAKLAAIALDITRSLRGAPGVQPVNQVLVVGHADMDVARERSDPGFLQFISERRAQSALIDLECRIDQALQNRISWAAVGRGARYLAVSSPRTEAERRCNRRVEIMLLTGPQPPSLDPEQNRKAFDIWEVTKDWYRIALQGTSGQYERSQVADQKAREIAVRVQLYLAWRGAKKRSCSDELTFLGRFTDVLPGTASKFTDPDLVVSKAIDLAEEATYSMQLLLRRTQWKLASLPQPMGQDCEPGGSVPSGPVNHVVCRPHDHIVDMNTRTVIAHNVEEYKTGRTASKPLKRPGGR
jgi:outer membrane protein OmpA-like peptidoglycan-associated protein